MAGCGARCRRARERANGWEAGACGGAAPRRPSWRPAAAAAPPPLADLDTSMPFLCPCCSAPPPGRARHPGRPAARLLTPETSDSAHSPVLFCRSCLASWAACWRGWPWAVPASSTPGPSGWWASMAPPCCSCSSWSTGTCCRVRGTALYRHAVFRSRGEVHRPCCSCASWSTGTCFRVWYHAVPPCFTGAAHRPAAPACHRRRRCRCRRRRVRRTLTTPAPAARPSCALCHRSAALPASLAGGALGALFTGLVASNAWEKGVPRCGSLGRSLLFSPESGLLCAAGPAGRAGCAGRGGPCWAGSRCWSVGQQAWLGAATQPHPAHVSLCRPAVERFMAIFWNWVWEPMLFVTIGASIDFSVLSAGTVPRSLIIICTGGWRGCYLVSKRVVLIGGARVSVGATQHRAQAAHHHLHRRVAGMRAAPALQGRAPRVHRPAAACFSAPRLPLHRVGSGRTRSLPGCLPPPTRLTQAWCCARSAATLTRPASLLGCSMALRRRGAAHAGHLWRDDGLWLQLEGEALLRPCLDAQGHGAGGAVRWACWRLGACVWVGAAEGGRERRCCALAQTPSFEHTHTRLLSARRRPPGADPKVQVRGPAVAGVHRVQQVGRRHPGGCWRQLCAGRCGWVLLPPLLLLSLWLLSLLLLHGCCCCCLLPPVSLASSATAWCWPCPAHYMHRHSSPCLASPCP